MFHYFCIKVNNLLYEGEQCCMVHKNVRKMIVSEDCLKNDRVWSCYTGDNFLYRKEIYFFLCKALNKEFSHACL